MEKKIKPKVPVKEKEEEECKDDVDTRQSHHCVTIELYFALQRGKGKMVIRRPCFPVSSPSLVSRFLKDMFKQ